MNQQHSSAHPSSLSIMTFNIRNCRANDGPNSWENRRELASSLIRAEAPDAIGIQEAYPEQVADLSRALPEYGAVGVGREDGKEEGEYCLILFRKESLRLDLQDTFWFSDTPDTVGSRSASWGNHCTRICTWARFEDKRQNTNFYLYNLHIDHESQVARERSIQLLMDRISKRNHPDPVIVTGDFNAGEDNPALKMLVTSESPKLIDTFRAAHPDWQNVSTFHAFRGGETGGKIDYIFASPDFQVQDSAILRTNANGRYPSDHYPLTARLSRSG